MLLEKWLRGTVEDTKPALMAIGRHSRSGPLPLSFAQQRLWFLNQLEPNSPQYNIPMAVRLHGKLDVDALTRAFDYLVARHESLRTTFASANGEPIQAISQTGKFDFDQVDLSKLSSLEREEKVLQLCTSQAQRIFDLSLGPLFAVLLVRLSADESVLMLTMHHIIADGWSIDVIIKDIMGAYEACRNGAQPSLPELKFQYGDYALWQREWLDHDSLHGQLDYWQQQLRELPLLELPTDRPRPPLQTYAGASQTFEVPPEVTAELRALSRREGVTLFMTLLTGFGVLLNRHTGQEDIPIGTPIANRTQREIESLIGFFANTLVMRVDFSGNPTVRELLKRVRELALNAYAHQDLPFEKLVEVLQPARDMSHTPLFQVLFVLESTPLSSISFSGLSMEPMLVPSATSKFDVTLLMWERDDGLAGMIEYNTDLFDKQTIEAVVQRFQVLLKSIVANPDARIASVPLLTEAETRLLIHQWNDTNGPCASEPLHTMFEREVEKRPAQPAVIFGEQTLTYADVNARANRLAHLLRRHGVSDEAAVAICVERSSDMVTALLGVLKAGGAALALDLTYPAERLAFTMRDASISALLTHRSLLPRLSYEGKNVICVDEPSLLDQESPDNLDLPIHPDNLAYIIYTSGSTGQPKGIAMTHGSLSNLVNWQMSRSAASIETRTSQFATFGFCVSYQEIGATLCSGGALIIVPETIRHDIPALRDFIGEQRIERLFVPTVALQHLAESCADRALSFQLTEVITSGELLQATDGLTKLFGRLSECSLTNHYGASETHVATSFKLSQTTSEWRVIPPVGYPITNARVFLLSPYLEPVPVGVTGEVCVGGICIARSYLNRPELTAEKFIPDPFGSEPGARLYRTGDLARRLPDGAIEILGRADTQVKIRGFRVELGEVEAALAACTGVAEAVVVAKEFGAGEKRIIGYVVPAKGAALTAGHLHDYLKRKLPDYMIPYSFVLLEALPLNSNGKVERSALPAPTSARPDVDQEFVPAANSIEEIVTRIWSELLGVDAVGIDDNFFDLGGHSLLATQVVSRVRQMFGAELSLREFFESPTVRCMSRNVAEANGSKQEPLSQVDRKSGLPLSYAQQRLWFLDQMEPENPFYNISLGVRLRGPLNQEALRATFADIIRRHEILRTTFEVGDGSPTQKITDHFEFDLETVDLSGMASEQQRQEEQRILQSAAQRPFDLTQLPLLRVMVLRLSDREHVLLLTMHHIVADGWSMDILVREINALYPAHASGQDSPLPPLEVQYADFAVWQRQWLEGELLEQELAYWRRRLEGVAPIELPSDRPRPAVQSYRGANEHFEISPEFVKQLKKLAREEGATLFMVLLGAFQILLSRYTGQTDIAVGTPVANRNRSEIEPLIGFFVNTLVMRTDLTGNPTFRQVLKNIKEVAAEAYAHQNVPFEKLVEELQPARDLGRQPLFQIVFALQNAMTETLKLPGLSYDLVAPESQTAKFDLTLTTWEDPAGALAGACVYSSDLFEAASIVRLLDHFQTLLQSIVANPDTAISRLALLGKEEQAQVVARCYGAAQAFPEICAHELFRRQAEATPNTIALRDDEGEISYQALNERANRLARHLRSLGVGPEVIVGICMERSSEVIVAVLAVLKAGGAYLPLDPGTPLQRLDFILNDAAAAILLTQSKLVDQLPAYWGHTICVDEISEALLNETSDDVRSPTQLDNLAYVIYTSGSTGIPKAVMVSHRALTNYICWAKETFVDGGGDGAPLHSSISFDLSVTSLFGPLISGHCVRVLPERAPFAPLDEDLKREPDYSFVKLTPSHLSVLAEQLRDADIRDAARGYVIGGENLLWRQLGALATRVGDSKFYNEYGPTEATVGCCFADVSAPDSADGSAPIGRPIANTGIYVLSDQLDPTPTGVVGEIYVSGAGLVRGYLGQPGWTAERFLPNPFGLKSGDRMYRTGDLGRYRADGTLEYLGRTDQQVKIRGYRIELGEIESVLSQHPMVEQCVTVAREDARGELSLVAYVVVNADAEITDEPLYQLPNGLKISQLNKNETDFVYQEVFEDRSYLKHSITLDEGDCVFDVGANIGLFTLFAYAQSANVKVYTFEPLPPTFKVLQTNIAQYGLAANTFRLALGRESGRLAFTHYPRMSVMSGAYADAPEDQTVARTTLTNQNNELASYADELLAGRFDSETFECEVKTLSDVIAEQGVERIDLLKIDVEKSELDVLLGVREHDWPKLKQIVIETHDVDGRLEQIESLLRQHGFAFVRDQDEILKGTGIYQIYAVHPSRRRASQPEISATHDKDLENLRSRFVSRLNSQLREYLSERLPAYMLPGAFVRIAELPLTPAGKVDRAALPAPDREALAVNHFVAPQTDTEKRLATIWGELMMAPMLGIHDNFFDLGGHSLLAVQLISRLQEHFGVDVQLRAVFEAPTIAELAAVIDAAPRADAEVAGGGIVPLARDRGRAAAAKTTHATGE